MSAYPDEETRAAQWRADTLARIAFQAAAWASIAAPPEPRQAVLDAWQPIMAANAERRAGPIDPKDDP